MKRNLTRARRLENEFLEKGCEERWEFYHNTANTLETLIEHSRRGVKSKK